MQLTYRTYHENEKNFNVANLINSLHPSDTDSLLFHVETEDLYEDFKDMSEHLDMSEYPEDHPLFSLDNKAVPGKMKDEAKGMLIEEFVGLR